MELDATFYTAAGPRVRLVDADTFEQLHEDGYLKNRSFVFQELYQKSIDGPIYIGGFYIIDVDGPSEDESDSKEEVQPSPAPQKKEVEKPAEWECLGLIPVYYYSFSDVYNAGNRDGYCLYERGGRYQIRNNKGQVFYVLEAKQHRKDFQYYFYDSGDMYFNV